MIQFTLGVLKKYTSKIWQLKSKRSFLRESEVIFRGLLETAYDSILIVNEKGNIEFANRQTKTWLGYEPEELIGKPIEILIPDRFVTSHHGKRNEYMKQPVSRPMGRNLQLFARKKDGSEFPVEISLTPFKTPHGTIVTAFLKDMTDQKRAEEQQRFLAETSHILNETMDYQERVQRITEVVVPHLADWCTIHILEEKGLKLKAFAQQASRNRDLVKRLAENNFFVQEESKLNFSAVTKPGDSVFIEDVTDQILRQFAAGDEARTQQIKSLQLQSLILIPLTARGKTIGIISFARDKPLRYTQKDLAFAKLVAARVAITIDNARLYKEAQSAIRLREDMLAIVSHDLKNPLGVVRGYNELISESLRNNSIGQMEIQSTDAIARSVRQMERLVADLLDFSKIESGTFTIEPKQCSVDRLIWESVELVKKHADKKGIRIQVDFQDRLPSIVCDPDRMKQVLANLVGNAIKFSPEFGVVRIQANSTPAGLEFAIKDNGPGITQENLAHIFDRYWQAKETAKFGTGLGLSIAKGIVESHSGRIWVKSELGVGTNFYFTLPAGALNRTNALEVQQVFH